MKRRDTSGGTWSRVRVSVLHLTRVASQPVSLSLSTVISETLKMPYFFQKMYGQSWNSGVRSVVYCNPPLVPILILKNAEHVHVLLNSIITDVESSSRSNWLLILSISSRMLWNTNVYYFVHNSLPLVCVLSQINAVSSNLPPSPRLCVIFRKLLIFTVR